MSVISPDGIVPWATQIRFTPPLLPGGVRMYDKLYTEINTCEYVTHHSVVGRESRTADGVPNRFLSGEVYLGADGIWRYTSNAAASCVFILRLSFGQEFAELIQMYRMIDCAWTSGSRPANTRSVAIEAEGGNNPFDEPLDAGQVRTLMRLYTDIEEWQAVHRNRPNWRAVRNNGNPFAGTLVNHSEWANHPFAGDKSDPTACPSNRYAAAYRLAEDRPPTIPPKDGTDMTPEDRELLVNTADMVQKLNLAIQKRASIDDEYGVQIGNLKVRVDEFEKQLKTVQGSSKELGDKFAALNADYGTIKDRLEEIEARGTALPDEIGAVIRFAKG